MSKAIVVIMKIIARPNEEVGSSSNFCATANPVIDGLVNNKFNIRIVEMPFATNNDVFIYSSI